MFFFYLLYDGVLTMDALVALLAVNLEQNLADDFFSLAAHSIPEDDTALL